MASVYSSEGLLHSLTGSSPAKHVLYFAGRPVACICAHEEQHAWAGEFEQGELRISERNRSRVPAWFSVYYLRQIGSSPLNAFSFSDVSESASLNTAPESPSDESAR